VSRATLNKEKSLKKSSEGNSSARRRAVFVAMLDVEIFYKQQK